MKYKIKHNLCLGEPDNYQLKIGNEVSVEYLHHPMNDRLYVKVKRIIITDMFSCDIEEYFLIPLAAFNFIAEEIVGS